MVLTDLVLSDSAKNNRKSEYKTIKAQMDAPASTSPNFVASSVKMFLLATTGRKKILKFLFYSPEKVVR